MFKSYDDGLSAKDKAMFARLINHINRDLDPEYIAQQEAAKAEREAAEQAQAQRDFEAAKSDAVYFASAEFREEVMQEIIANGATRLQAEGRTRDQARLFNEARELGLM